MKNNYFLFPERNNVYFYKTLNCFLCNPDGVLNNEPEISYWQRG
jgi:hypothetical protein